MIPTQLYLEGLPLRPEVLAELTELELGPIFASIGLDAEQQAVAVAAIAVVQGGTYPVTAVTAGDRMHDVRVRESRARNTMRQNGAERSTDGHQR